MRIEKKDIDYICIVDTTYTLSLYLLYQPDDAIQKTAYFVGRAIPESVSSFLSFVVRIDNSKVKWNYLLHRLEALFRWRFRNGRIMYAQDHLVYSSHLIGSNRYILLEDAPHIYKNYKDIKFMRPLFPRNKIAWLWELLLNGPVGKRKLGTNPQCIDRLVTSEEDINSDLLVGKKYTLVNLHDLWETSSASKQNLIRRMFEISDQILILPNKCSTIIFSQPLMEDCKLSEDEMLEIYAPYIEKYSNSGIAIKPHPRDKFQYRNFFPNIEMLECKAPMQLLSAMGISFKTAITVCSSAVSSMPENTEIIWIGTRINKKIYSVYGDLKCPR